MNDTRKPAQRTAATARTSQGFTDSERGAMKERAQELRASARRGSRAAKAAEEEAAVLAKIAEMTDSDRGMAERLHAIVKAGAPGLAPKLWYGMPSYAKDGKVVCFFQSAQKFGTRYATLGFSDRANLDVGAVWATSYALTGLSAEDEVRIGALVKQAAS
ncbi:iron chaperone [Streptomyces sp. NPDC059193]|uniref:iron chaperone n=1 Tax=Streptomyces sp. NPDC059193 TaxID=3346763 RepID=UPI00368CF994